MALWLQLLLCLAVIAYAGYFLSRFGDIIAEKSRISGECKEVDCPVLIPRILCQQLYIRHIQ